MKMIDKKMYKCIGSRQRLEANKILLGNEKYVFDEPIYDKDRMEYVQYYRDK